MEPELSEEKEGAEAAAAALALRQQAAAAAAQHEQQRGVPLAAVAAGLEGALPAEDSDVEASDLEAELEGLSRSQARSFASLFTDDEFEEVAEVDPSLLLVNCGLSAQTVRGGRAGQGGVAAQAGGRADVWVLAAWIREGR